MKIKNTAIFVLLSAASLLAQQSGSAQAPAAAGSTKPAAPATQAPRRYVPNQSPLREQMYYVGVWGIDSLKVKYTESGEMIRFSYRVLDPAKAAQLNDKKSEPYLYDPQAGVKLVIPEMEKVGKMRQSSTPIAGNSYWMAFSNSGRRVKPGDRVSIEIGHFRAINLLVE